MDILIICVLNLNFSNTDTEVMGLCTGVKGTQPTMPTPKMVSDSSGETRPTETDAG